MECTALINDEVDDSVAGRVTEGEQANGFGFPEFILHSALCSDASVNTEYCINDSLKFQVTAVTL